MPPSLIASAFAAVFLLASPCTASAAATTAPFQLAVEDLECPSYGIEARTPRFRWAVPSNQANQSSFHLIVRTLPTNAVVWDSGVVNSTLQSTIYNGPALSPASTYSFSVSTLDGSTSPPTPSPFSEEGRFITGLWGQWPSPPIWHPNGTADFVFLRVDVPISSFPSLTALATAFVTANPQGSSHGETENAKLLAAYRLYINGVLIGLGPGRPGTCGPVCPVGGDSGVCTCTPTHGYDTYNITQVLAAAIAASGEGGNVTIAVQAFNYAPTNGSSTLSAVSKVALEIALTSTDGTTTLLPLNSSSSSTWTSFNADAYFNPSCCVSDQSWYLQPRENFVAALEPVGWRLPNFTSTGSEMWLPAASLPPFGSGAPGSGQGNPLIARPTLSITVTEDVQPASIITLGPGHYFIDFGKEIQGGLTISFGPDAVLGQQVEVRLGEELLSIDPPAVKYEMRTGNSYYNVWTLRDGMQTLSHHEYMEFRYVELVGAAQPGQCVVTEVGDYASPVTLTCGGSISSSSSSSASSSLPIISAIEFASWGTPSGQCLNNASSPSANTFSVNATCNYDKSAEVLASLCVGKNNCTFIPSDAVFGNVDPCDKTAKYLAAAVTCTGGSGGGGGGGGGSPFPAPTSITAWRLEYPAPGYDALQVQTSNDDLNRIWAMCQYTVVATGLDLFTDSNTRQRSVICNEAMNINIRMQYATSRETTLQLYTLQYALNHHPSGGFGWAEWPQLAIFSIYDLWWHTGDLSVFLDMYEHARNFTEVSLIANSTTGLWTCPPSNPWQCNHPEIDWPSNMRDGFVFVPADTVVNAYTYRASLLFAQMAQAAGGHDDDVAFFTSAAAALRTAMNEQLYNSSTGCYIDGLGTSHQAWHASLFALAFGVPTPDILPSVMACVVNGSIGIPETCLPSNVYPANWALEAFFENANDHGMRGVSLLTCNGTNSWMALLRQNATTTPEAWSPDEKENETFSHPWTASPAHIILRWILGLRPLLAGFASVIVMPQLGSLTSAAGTVPSVRGPFTVAVNQTLGGGNEVTSMSINFSLPGNTQARLCMPAFACAVSGGASYSIVLDGIATSAFDSGDDYACVDGVGAGAHTAVCVASSEEK